jgi:Tubulin-tyrosine ligase family
MERKKMTRFRTGKDVPRTDEKGRPERDEKKRPERDEKKRPEKDDPHPSGFTPQKSFFRKSSFFVLSGRFFPSSLFVVFRASALLFLRKRSCAQKRSCHDTGMAVPFHVATSAGYDYVFQSYAVEKAAKAEVKRQRQKTPGFSDPVAAAAADIPDPFPPSCLSLRAAVAKGNHYLMLAMLRENGFSEVPLEPLRPPVGNSYSPPSSPLASSPLPPPRNTLAADGRTIDARGETNTQDQDQEGDRPPHGDWSLCWTGAFRRNRTDRLPIHPRQRINHFPRSQELSRKDRYYRTVGRFVESLSNAIDVAASFDFVPETYTLPGESSQACEGLMRDPSALWIQKPADSSRGRGVFLFRAGKKLEKLQKRLAQQQQEEECDEDHTDSEESGPPSPKPCVISRYIDSPLLIDGRKFDFRFYVAITSFDPLVVFLFRDGLVRFANQAYKKSTLNRFVHLTNYSVNKLSDDYEFNTDAKSDGVGSKWSVSALLRRVEEDYGVDSAEIMSGIEDVLAKSALSAAKSISRGLDVDLGRELSSCCFELLGFDILIDSNFKPWILEANLSPSITCDSPLDFALKSQMLAELLNVVGVYPCPPGGNSTSVGACPAGELCRCKDATADVPKERDTATAAQGTGWKKIFPVDDTHARFDEYSDLLAAAALRESSN